MKEILRRHSFSITFLVVLFSYFFLFSSEENELSRLSGYTMGTTYNLQIVEFPNSVDKDEIATEVTQLLSKLDTAVFSTYSPDSELSRFNRHAVGVAFDASQELIDVLVMAAEISEFSDGAFDVTVGPLVNLWGFGPTLAAGSADVPSQESIDVARSSMGYDLISIDVANSQISRRADIYVDLSAIAKGYAVDQLADYFDALGVEDYFLEVGGELKIKGFKPGRQSWIPAIEAPLDSASQIYEVFYSHGEEIAVAGSGDYRNYFEADGVRYSHEIDPRTGRPIDHTLAAAYVIESSTARADALATAFMVMGLEAGRELALNHDLAVYFIYKVNGAEADFAEYISPSFASYLRENN